MRGASSARRLAPVCSAILAAALGAGEPEAGPPVAIRAEHFTVPPSTGPVTYVLVRNLRDAAYEGRIRLNPPEGWRVAPAARSVKLGPRATARVSFTIERAVDRASNAYPIEVIAEGSGGRVARKQRVVCASAPYFKPRIDGDLEDWGESIPVTFLSRGKRTVVRTSWTRRAFSLAVEVEEEALIRRGARPPQEGFDAVQVAVSKRGARTGSSRSDPSARYEFLLFASTSSDAPQGCVLLMEPGMPLATAEKRRSLTGLDGRGARLAVGRRGGITRYECSIPFTVIRAFRPTPGREFCFSILVHDPDGTGVRDWGEAAGLWTGERNRLAWCSWEGVAWGEEPPFDNKIEWGLCSSRH